MENQSDSSEEFSPNSRNSRCSPGALPFESTAENNSDEDEPSPFSHSIIHHTSAVSDSQKHFYFPETNLSDNFRKNNHPEKAFDNVLDFLMDEELDLNNDITEPPSEISNSQSSEKYETTDEELLVFEPDNTTKRGNHSTRNLKTEKVPEASVVGETNCEISNQKRADQLQNETSKGKKEIKDFCRHFNRGGCKWEKKCRFLHTNSGETQNYSVWSKQQGNSNVNKAGTDNNANASSVHQELWASPPPPNGREKPPVYNWDDEFFSGPNTILSDVERETQQEMKAANTVASESAKWREVADRCLNNHPRGREKPPEYDWDKELLLHQITSNNKKCKNKLEMKVPGCCKVASKSKPTEISSKYVSNGYPSRFLNSKERFAYGFTKGERRGKSEKGSYKCLKLQETEQGVHKTKTEGESLPQCFVLPESYREYMNYLNCKSMNKFPLEAQNTHNRRTSRKESRSQCKYRSRYGSSCSSDLYTQLHKRSSRRKLSGRVISSSIKEVSSKDSTRRRKAHCERSRSSVSSESSSKSWRYSSTSPKSHSRSRKSNLHPKRNYMSSFSDDDEGNGTSQKGKLEGKSKQDCKPNIKQKNLRRKYKKNRNEQGKEHVRDDRASGANRRATEPRRSVNPNFRNRTPSDSSSDSSTRSSAKCCLKLTTDIEIKSTARQKLRYLTSSRRKTRSRSRSQRYSTSRSRSSRSQSSCSKSPSKGTNRRSTSPGESMSSRSPSRSKAPLNGRNRSHSTSRNPSRDSSPTTQCTLQKPFPSSVKSPFLSKSEERNDVSSQVEMERFVKLAKNTNQCKEVRVHENNVLSTIQENKASEVSAQDNNCHTWPVQKSKDVLEKIQSNKVDGVSKSTEEKKSAVEVRSNAVQETTQHPESSTNRSTSHVKSSTSSRKELLKEIKAVELLNPQKRKKIKNSKRGRRKKCEKERKKTRSRSDSQRKRSCSWSRNQYRFSKSSSHSKSPLKGRNRSHSPSLNLGRGSSSEIECTLQKSHFRSRVKSPSSTKSAEPNVVSSHIEMDHFVKNDENPDQHKQVRVDEENGILVTIQEMGEEISAHNRHCDVWAVKTSEDVTEKRPGIKVDNSKSTEGTKSAKEVRNKVVLGTTQHSVPSTNRCDSPVKSSCNFPRVLKELNAVELSVPWKKKKRKKSKKERKRKD